MSFFEILHKLNLPTQNFTDFEVAGLATDSRKVKENYIFFALKGENFNGEDFIPDSVRNGAKAIITTQSFPNTDLQTLVSKFCSIYFNDIPENYIAVTGTNGKTSTVNFIAQILNRLGKNSASVGTLGVLINGDFEKNICDTGMTSPDIITLYENLSTLKKQNINYVAIEASSHGLHQNRFGKLKFDICCFTNFTQDHLDYHKTFEEYFSAKKLLFTNFTKPGSVAVLNADISEYTKLKKTCEENNIKVFDYGNNGKTLKILNSETENYGLKIYLEYADEVYSITPKLYGAFQVENIACAILAVANYGFTISEVIKACNDLKPVKGRMEVINIPRKKASAAVDYAHTPDALEKAIKAAKKHSKNRIITIFGCGGDRDKTKRPLMGKIAIQNSDIVIVTDDNPRTENAEQIRKEILAQAKNAIEIADRKEAILHGLNILQEGDVLLVAGKGHEDYQIIGDKKIHFSDSEVIKNYENLE